MRAHFSSLLCIAALAGCSTPSTPTDGGGVDAFTTADTGPATDTGPASDTGTTADAGPTPHGGIIHVEQSAIGGPGTSGHMSALFGNATVATFETLDFPGCTRHEVGSCLSVSCGSTVVPPTLASAGTLTLGIAGSAPLDVMPRASGSYDAMTGNITPGSEVSIMAAGDVVPAFALTATAPGVPAGTVPSTISMASDLVITWDPAVAASEVLFYVGPQGASGMGRALVTCTVPASDGTVTVDASLLPDVGAGSGIAGLRGVAATVGTAGDYDIELQVSLGAATSVTITE